MKINLHRMSILIFALILVLSTTGCFLNRSTDNPNKRTVMNKEQKADSINKNIYNSSKEYVGILLNKEQIEDSVNKNIYDSSKEYVRIKFFMFEDSGGEIIKVGDRVSYSIEGTPVYKSFSKTEYDKNYSKILKDSIKEIYKIELNKIELKAGNKLVVDMNENSVTDMNIGSTGSYIFSRNLINTFINLPNVKAVEFTYNGDNNDAYADHFNLTGIFKRNEKGEIVNTSGDHWTLEVI